MSSLGKKIITAVKEADQEGLITLRVSPNIAELRKKLKLTQQEFAECYRINPETLKSWEQHKREPDSISKAYLKCIEQDPRLIKKLVNS